MPLGDGSERTPIEAVLDDDSRGLPFSHAFCRIDNGDAALQTHEKYSRLLASLGNPRAYNLLATRDWMLVVPRARETWNSISVNALGFAGALLVRSEDEWSQLERLCVCDVMYGCDVLSQVHDVDPFRALIYYHWWEKHAKPNRPKASANRLQRYVEV